MFVEGRGGEGRGEVLGGGERYGGRGICNEFYYFRTIMADTSENVMHTQAETTPSKPTPSASSLEYLLHPITVQAMVRAWLREDTPNFDYGGFVVGEKRESAILLCKSEGENRTV